MKQSKKVTSTNASLKFKRPQKGPESDLIKSFIDDLRSIFEENILESRIFNEPYVGTTIPDIVIAFWDESIFHYWEENRNHLEVRDIKILHHMYLKENFSDIDILQYDLGYSKSEIEKTLTRLMNADLLIEKGRYFKTKSLGHIFFVKAIISIEAKIKNWKKAFEQARLNEFFASESYVLLPKSKINQSVIKHAAEQNIGLISHRERETNIVKKAIKKEIPVSYSSWIFNENIGRELYYANSIKANI